jgi:hypothetical protein
MPNCSSFEGNLSINLPIYSSTPWPVPWELSQLPATHSKNPFQTDKNGQADSRCFLPGSAVYLLLMFLSLALPNQPIDFREIGEEAECGYLAGMKFGGSELVGLIAAVSFAAGLNVYATVATLGLLANAGLLDLPTGLHLITSWWVITASGILFAIEFFADKIPAFDLFWNALHTFVRIPVAALIAYGATAQLSPQKQLLATLAGGAIALAAHGGKTAARVAVTPSPEPASNFVLSAGEDTLAVFLTWLATRHPIAAGTIVVVFLVVIVVVMRWVVRAMKNLFRGAENELAPSKRRI